MSDIIIIGSINMDVVALAPHHPIPGETILGSTLDYIPGGKGSNQAVAAARSGGHVRLVTRLGNDSFGNTLMEFLSHEPLDTRDVRLLSDVPTGVAIIVVSETGENTIVVVPGANRHILPQDVDRLSIQAGDVVVSQLEIPFDTVGHAFRVAHQCGAVTLLNPSPAASLPAGLMADCDYLVMNEIELAFYAGQAVSDDSASVIAAIHALRATPSQTIIVTMGARGIVAVRADEIIHEPAFPVTVVDTTGAGDCFTGALTTALSEQQSLRQAIRFANAAAALSVQTLGASASLPTRREIDHFLKQST